MSTIKTPYENLLKEILENGNHKGDRTGTGTLSLFGKQIRYDLSESFPLITTKKVAWKALVGELLWFIDGDTNNNTLLDNNIKIWNDWRRPYLLKNKKQVTINTLEKPSNILDNVKETKNTDIPDINITLLEEYNRIIEDVNNGDYTIEPEWIDYSVFQKEVQEAPQYWYKNNSPDDFILYGDYYKNKHYSKDTVVWISKEECDYYDITTNRLEIFEDGDLGNVYGHQWRSWGAPNGEIIDQLSQVIETLKNNPDSRRIIVSAWNVGELDNMALPPCHLLFQFYVADGKLSCQLYQRSADMFLGVPFNIASYSLLTHMIAQQVGLEVGEFIWTGGDCHIYTNHIEQVKEQLSREPRPYPQLELNKKGSLFDYDFDDCKVTGYNPHPAIKGKVSV